MTHARFAPAAALSAAVLAAATLTPASAALAGPGEGALGLDVNVVKIAADTGEEIGGATFGIAADFGLPTHITELGAEPPYDWPDFVPTCDLPDAGEDGFREAEADCMEAFFLDTYGEPLSEITAPGGARIVSTTYGHVPWDQGVLTLTETVAPEGYVLAEEPIVIGVSDAFDYEILSGPDGAAVVEEGGSGSYSQTITVTVPNEPVEEPEPEPTEEPEPTPEPEPTEEPTTEPPAPTVEPTPEPTEEAATVPPAAPEPQRAAGPVVRTGASADAPAWKVAIHNIMSAIRG